MFLSVLYIAIYQKLYDLRGMIPIILSFFNSGTIELFQKHKHVMNIIDLFYAWNAKHVQGYAVLTYGRNLKCPEGFPDFTECPTLFSRDALSFLGVLP